MKRGTNKIELESYNEQFVGQSIEDKVFVATETGAPIEATSPIIYTPRSEGVAPQYNIRTDRWLIAQQAMDKVSKSQTARRAEYMKKSKAMKSAETASSAEPLAV